MDNEQKKVFLILLFVTAIFWICYHQSKRPEPKSVVSIPPIEETTSPKGNDTKNYKEDCLNSSKKYIDWLDCCIKHLDTKKNIDIFSALNTQKGLFEIATDEVGKGDFISQDFFQNQELKINLSKTEIQRLFNNDNINSNCP